MNTPKERGAVGGDGKSPRAEAGAHPPWRVQTWAEAGAASPTALWLGKWNSTAPRLTSDDG